MDESENITEIKVQLGKIFTLLENLEKSMVTYANDHDRLIKLDVNLTRVISDTDDYFAKLHLLEEKLEILKDWKIQVVSYAMGVGAVVSVIIAIFSKIFFK
jgi:hypothetical protein